MIREVKFIGHKNNSHDWFKKKVQEYHGNKVELVSEYTGSINPIDIMYHCDLHGDTFTTINAKNICKQNFLPCKKCQSINKSKAGKNSQRKNKIYYYNRLVSYCESRGGQVLEKEWTKAKNIYHFKCKNPNHPVFTSTADSLLNGEHWCPYCSGRSGDFETELLRICKKKDGELLSKYKTAQEYVTVKCNKHNYIWETLPGNIKKGRWCPICSMGFNEKVVWDYLNDMNCKIEIQYKFDDLYGKNDEKLKFDFAVFNFNGDLVSLIEVDDEEHRYKQYIDTPRQLERRESCKRDRMKDDYCKKNNIPLYRMTVPFRKSCRWSYDDYYRYISTKLKEIVNTSRKELKC